ncbi:MULTISPECIES: globin family protein [Actibacterium]|uniref:Nitric oxide dioxygenase n=1 Tax=Actibacterium naphthalenivorans TaxID=1614693 RepID=A0A840C4U6_9RHOB|nr:MULTISPECIES: globin family protein [Actibacterium]ALG89536.1 hemin receptor [Actibacterium sp. EMB200-NS6]MBB4020814.1 nitric oxide dioxygenase [Actibacterium naphthalenivorans]
MTPEQIDMVQGSFAKVVPIKDAAAAIFYARLFEIAPEVKPYFKGDMTEQGAKLMATLGVVVNGLKNLDAIVPVAQKLAVGHVAYGVKPEDYQSVGAALLYTLGQGLGDGFTPEVEAAWTEAYTILSGVMIGAAYPAAAE